MPEGIITHQEFKRRWVEALLSGKYTKIKKKLRNNKNGRCCLGVACDVAIEMFPDRFYWEDGNIVDTKAWGIIKQDTVLPSGLLRIVSSTNHYAHNPSVNVDKTEITLAELNDEKDWSLEQIAAVIQEQL